MNSSSILDFLKRSSFFLIITGVILVILAATDILGLGSYHLIVNPAWRYVLAGVATVFLILGIVMLLRESKQSSSPKGPILEQSTAQQLAKCGLVHAFRIPIDNPSRLNRVRELIEQEAKGNRKLRLAASSGFSYLNPIGPVWADAGLGKLITDGVVDMVVVLESPFSHFALTRALANGVEHHQWQEKQTPENLVTLLQYPNVSIRVTDMAVNCSLFLTSQAVYYDPYLWGLPHAGERTENKFWVLEFTRISDKDCDCYTLLEKHFEFLLRYSVPLEEVLHAPKKDSQLPRGVDFYRFLKENPVLALDRYEALTKEFRQNVRRLGGG